MEASKISAGGGPEPPRGLEQASVASLRGHAVIVLPSTPPPHQLQQHQPEFFPFQCRQPGNAQQMLGISNSTGRLYAKAPELKANRRFALGNDETSQ